MSDDHTTYTDTEGSTYTLTGNGFSKKSKDGKKTTTLTKESNWDDIKISKEDIEKMKKKFEKDSPSTKFTNEFEKRLNQKTGNTPATQPTQQPPATNTNTNNTNPTPTPPTNNPPVNPTGSATGATNPGATPTPPAQPAPQPAPAAPTTTTTNPGTNNTNTNTNQPIPTTNNPTPTPAPTPGTATPPAQPAPPVPNG